MRDIPVNTGLQLPAAPSRGLDRLTPAQQAVHNNFLVAYDGLKQNLVRTIFYLRAVMDGKIHNLLGYARITDYAQHYAGLSHRQTQELLVLGNRLGQLPQIAEALERGDLSWSQAREIVRHAEPEDQRQWIDVARSVSRQELRERLKQGTPEPPAATPAPTVPENPQQPSSPPTPAVGLAPQTMKTPALGAVTPLVPSEAAAPKPLAKPIADEQYLRITMTAEQYAVWESLLEELRKQNPGMTPAQAMLDNMASTLSSDERGGARSPYLIVLFACPECGQARIPTSRGEAEAGPALLAAAGCDGVIERPDGARRQVVLPRLRRLALKRARYTCEAGNCRHTRFLEVHHRVPVANGGRTDLDNLVVLCSRCHRQLHEHESTLIGQRRRIEDIAHQWSRNSKNRSDV